MRGGPSTTMRREDRGLNGGRAGSAATPPTSATPVLVLAFAPLHRRAFGVALGTAAALVVFAVTAARLLLDPAGRTNLSYLAQFFPGYQQSWGGALVGAAWAFAVGFAAGWVCAAVRNFVIAAWLFFVRGRAELDATRDLLDDI
jgi:uncharacterized membrane protein YedE/YeeE